MRSVSNIVEAVIGQAFEIDCLEIKLRDASREYNTKPHFSGPGSIGGDIDGNFHFRLYNTIDIDPKELMRLTRSAADGSGVMALDAIDYEGTDWTGAWFVPKIHVSSATNQCLVRGNFPQLSTRIPFSPPFDREPNVTRIYYSSAPRLPMLKKTRIQRVRDETTESSSTRWDHSHLDFGGASIKIEVNEDENRTTLATTYRDKWQPPYCEVGLADAFAFVTATDLQPRIIVRGFEKDALVFLRYTPPKRPATMPRAVIAPPLSREAFWNVFLDFLRDCERNIIRNPNRLDSTHLFRLFSELVSASTGTIHGFILSLVVAIEDIVDQIVGRSTCSISTRQVKKYLTWTGPANLKERAIGILSSFLGLTSTNAKLRQLVAKGVVTEDQRKVWDELRNKVAIAHGKLVDYDDERLIEKRNQLMTMFYRLVLRLLMYQGPLSDYGKWPPGEFDFRWVE